jgi:hypothetical protein
VAGREGILARLHQAFFAPRYQVGPVPSDTSDGRAAVGPTQRVLFCGLFPPPFDGQRIVTKWMLDHLSPVASVTPYNLQPELRGGKSGAALAKLVRTLGSLPLMCRQRIAGCSRLYLAPHSGHGILYACLIALAARALRFRIFVHYHSSVHFARRDWRMATFLRLCGGKAVHIVLAPPMAEALTRLYGAEKQWFVLSNSAFFAVSGTERSFDRRRLRVGHLSNLSHSKGIDLVLQCAERLQASGLDVEMVLAGPVDSAAHSIVQDALARLVRVRHLGPLAPDEVKQFYRNIDVFLFPTRHPHEAEPLVIIDALAAGVPVIATDRGYLAHLLDDSSGSLLLEPETFVERAVEQLGIWERDRQALAQASRSAQARALTLCAEAKRQLSRLIQKMTEPATTFTSEKFSGRRAARRAARITAHEN